MADKNVQQILGANIKNARLKKKWSQKTLAEKTKLSPSFVVEIENGKKFPSSHSLQQLATALEVKYFQLFFTPTDKKAYDKETLLNKLGGDLKNAIDKTIKSYI